MKGLQYSNYSKRSLKIFNIKLYTEVMKTMFVHPISKLPSSSIMLPILLSIINAMATTKY